MLIRCGENWIDPTLVGTIMVYKAGGGPYTPESPGVSVGGRDGSVLVVIACPDDEEARRVADFIAAAVNGEPRP